MLNQQKNQGGLGAVRAMKNRAELKLVKRSIIQGWPVPQSQRDKAVVLANEVLASAISPKRDKAIAREVLELIARQNNGE